MKPIAKQSSRKTGFTIIELLTVMSIIVILISLLVPALNMVKRYAKRVKQKAQFHAISVALDIFNAEWEGYPPSDAQDADNNPYCGAMKLSEAMVGQDLKGFHPASLFRQDGQDALGNPLYPTPPQVATMLPDVYAENLRARRMYLQLENANANKLKHLYGVGNTAPFDGEEVVLCDVYKRISLRDDPGDPTDDNIKGKSGMPILYYRANTSNTLHKYSTTDNSVNIYNCEDNQALINLGLPWNSNLEHPMASTGGPTSTGGNSDAGVFYEKTRNDRIATQDRPYRADSYILISAGFDGEYGTSDDVFNFGD